MVIGEKAFTSKLNLPLMQNSFVFLHQATICLCLVAALGCASGAIATASADQSLRKPFSVADELGLTVFGIRWKGQAVQFSPDSSYIAVYAERGRLDLNCIEGTLRIYRSVDVESYLEHPSQLQAPAPVWLVTRSGKEGPIFIGWRWLVDSSGVAFLEPLPGGRKRLVLADVLRRTIEPLTSESEIVQEFDVRDREHYVYSVSAPAADLKLMNEEQEPRKVGTGRSLYELLFPDNPKTVRLSSPKSYLWAVVGGKRFQIKYGDMPVGLSDEKLALSPDCNSVVTTALVPKVPQSWEALYPPPYASSAYRIRADPDGARQYVQINLRTGVAQPLTDAPVGESAGWWGHGDPKWSNNGRDVLLPGTFLKAKNNAPSRPCVAVVEAVSRTARCVEMLKGMTEAGVEKGFHLITGARFVGTDDQRIIVTYRSPLDYSLSGMTEYRRMADERWQVTGESNRDSPFRLDRVEVTVKEGLSQPPQLVAANKDATRVIWDPNPQLKNIEQTSASVYRWKDKAGRDWSGGLFMPGNYKVGQVYPLTILTHGFSESEFIPSLGIFPTRSLAAAGIIVLQVKESCPEVTVEEGPCAVSGYEEAVNQLVSKGLVDKSRIGIAGFSRTCFYVMEALTTPSVRFKAASIADGITLDYVEYMQTDRVSHEFDAMIGAAPFAEGLRKWLERSPGFNLEKANTPLMVIAQGRLSLLSMWQPYAALRYLHKPVDLVMLNTDEHVLTNPAVHMASQDGTVDWFRFWLQNYEDPTPAKAEQYKRWQELRNLQNENEKGSHESGGHHR